MERPQWAEDESGEEPPEGEADFGETPPDETVNAGQGEGRRAGDDEDDAD